MNQLPDYVVINNDDTPQDLKEILRQPAEPFNFPLIENDLAILKVLEDKFENEKNCAGIAAPQLGFKKSAFIFAVLDDPALKKWRTDLEETIEKSIWLNPSYEPIGDEVQVDYEACFSVANLTGPVERAKKIRYEAYSKEGEKISGVASGFMARVIQHEIDHLNGKLFIDFVKKEDLMTINEYINKREKKLEV